MRQFFLYLLLCIFSQITYAQLKKTIPINPPIKDPVSVRVPPVGITNNNSTPAPLTLSELNQKVADLETFVNNIYKSQKIITITADNSNLFDEYQSHQFPLNNVILRIDNPICNNNPEAKIFYSPTFRSSPILQAIYYESPYWYASFYSMIPSNLGPYDIIPIKGGGLNGDDILVPRKFELAGSYIDAIQLGSRNYLTPGEKFIFAIFLPVKIVLKLPIDNRPIINEGKLLNKAR